MGAVVAFIQSNTGREFEKNKCCVYKFVTHQGHW